MKIVCGWTVATASVVAAVVLATEPSTLPATHNGVASATTSAAVQIAYPAYLRQNATFTLGTTGILRVVGSVSAADVASAKVTSNPSRR